MSDSNKLSSIFEGRACNCIGRQNGEPLCPCRMRGVKVVDGRYVEVIDHGPVREITNIGDRWGEIARGVAVEIDGSAA